MGWLSKKGIGFGDNFKRSKSIDSKRSANLGILAFETAKTMSRLVAIFKSLSDQEITKLKMELIKSQGVNYLNSSDECFLLSLACAERLEDLDRIALAVARLGKKCSDLRLNRFDLVYTDLKLGIIDFENLEYGSRKMEKRVDKIERLIHATTSLYTSLEALAELEISERKLQQWKKNSSAMQTQKMNFELFDQKIADQRRQVRYLREVSLWSRTFDKSVRQMAQITCIVYAEFALFLDLIFLFYLLVALYRGQFRPPLSKVWSDFIVKKYFFLIMIMVLKGLPRIIGCLIQQGRLRWVVQGVFSWTSFNFTQLSQLHPKSSNFLNIGQKPI